MADPMAVVERVLQLLDEGRFSATYKHAVLLALLDLCVEGADKDGEPPAMVTTRQLAEKVIALYWPHARPWAGVEGDVLRQNQSVASEAGSGTILGRVHRFRDVLVNLTGLSVPIVRARQLDAKGWQRLCDDVEWILIDMPLPKLQRIGGQDAAWIYQIAWNDSDRAPTLADVRAYQRGTSRDFDNRVHLLPGVGLALARLHAVLRPFIQHQWAAKVASLNPKHVPEARLLEFLFGVERTSLAPIRECLVELQKGACFYCGARLADDAVHIDHFLPWARHPDDALGNLVAADKTCNGAKRDFLASADHVERWRRRLTDDEDTLAQVADHARWEVGSDRVLGAARSMYLPLPADARLWAGRSKWVVADLGQIRSVLA